MLKSTIKILSFAFILIFLNANSMLFAAETRSVNEHKCLNLYTWDAGAFIPHTVSSDDTIAAIPFVAFIYEYAPNGCPPPGNTMTSMQAKLSYDDNHWRFIGAEKTSNWPNDFQWDTVDNIGNNDYIRLYFTLGSGQGVPAPGLPAKSYATLKFVSLCQPENSYSPIYTIWDPDHFNQVTIDGNTWWLPEANASESGPIYVNNYSATTTAGNQSISRLITEEPEVELPVKVTSNFLTQSMVFSINYNSQKLQFLELTNVADIFPFGCGNCPNPGDNPINFDLPAISANNEMTDLQIFKLKFRVKAGWEGDTAQVNFNVNNCKIFTPTCADLSKPYTYHGGVVTVAPYHAELRTTWDPASGLLSRSGGPQNTYFWGEVKNGFPTDDAAGAIRFNYFTGSNWYFLGVVSCPECFGGLTFGRNIYDDTATVYQNNSNWIGVQPDFVKATKFGTQFIPGVFFPRNYADRYVPLVMDEVFQTNGNTYYSQVRDYTGTVTATVPNGKLTFAGNGMAEVKVGEFHTALATRGATKLYVKWNFNEAITSFSVNVSLTNSFSYGVFTPAAAFAGKINSDYQSPGVYRIYSNGNFTGMAYTGGYVELGTISYGWSCSRAGKGSSLGRPCGSYNVYANVQLTAPAIYSGSLVQQYGVTDTSSIYGTCNSCPDEQEPIRDPVDKGDMAGLPKEFKLNQNHPNPFNPETIVAYDVPSPAHVKLVVMNILGQEVATLVDEVKAAGSYEAVWRGTDNRGNRVSSGVYLCIMRAGDYSSSIKMALMK